MGTPIAFIFFQRGRPAHGIFNNLLHFRNIIIRILLVTRLEIEDISVAPVIAAAAAENFSALEPADEYQLVRLGDYKRLTVHFFVRNFKVFPQTLGDWMGRSNRPHPCLFFGASPFQVAAGSQKAHERFGFVGGVEKNHSHTAIDNGVAHPLDDFVRNQSCLACPHQIKTSVSSITSWVSPHSG